MTVHDSLAMPYSMKMRAIMRYRRLPFVWLQRFMVDDSETRFTDHHR